MDTYQALIRAGILLALICTPAAAWSNTLEVYGDDGALLLEWDMPDGDRWCLHWNHSVAGFLVRDCFVAVDGAMILERSHQPDFAAGLGHIPGRGVMTTAPEGGYWIENINEPIRRNCLALRVGSGTVNHRLVKDTLEESLSAVAERQLVRIVLRAPEAKGDNQC